MEVADLQHIGAKGEVEEADAGRVAVGQRVSLRLDAHPDIEFGGRVRSIGTTVQRRSWRDPLRVVELAVDLDSTDVQRMRPGMRFRGEIEVARLEDVLLVPNDAVVLAADGPGVVRRHLTGGVETPVVLGARNAEVSEVVSGLVEGDVVSSAAGEQRGGER